MRFKLYLKPARDRQPLLFNYQYPLQAWIYKLLHNADAEYAAFLHSRGYAVENSRKTFKHFTFSSLHIPQAERVKPGDTYITIRSEAIQLIVSFYLNKAAEDFIAGLFQHQQVSLYNRFCRADFVVERVEIAPPPPGWGEKNTVQFRTVSPMVVAEKTDTLDQYLSPVDAGFERYFGVNLWDKFRSVQPVPTMQLDAVAIQQLIRFRLLSDPERIKKRGFLAKEGKEDKQTKVIGYHHFTFELTAPPEVMEVGYFGGFGRFNAMGCGCVEVVNDS